MKLPARHGPHPFLLDREGSGSHCATRQINALSGASADRQTEDTFPPIFQGTNENLRRAKAGTQARAHAGRPLSRTPQSRSADKATSSPSGRARCTCFCSLQTASSLCARLAASRRTRWEEKAPLGRSGHPGEVPTSGPGVTSRSRHQPQAARTYFPVNGHGEAHPACV